MQEHQRIKVGISSCLLGNEVRFDGGHKRHSYITGTLSHYFDFTPLCPEVGAGLGTPRPTIHLLRVTSGDIRAVETRNPDADHTDALAAYSKQVMGHLQGVAGYILKKDSPSCGMERVRVYHADKPKSPPERKGQGIFASILHEHFPLLPVEEEGRLGDPILRENFIERVYIYHRWQQMLANQPEVADLVAFHSDHKYILMAHDQGIARELGQLVASAGTAEDFTALAGQYVQLMMTALGKRVSRGQHANVLMHLMGYLKNHLDAGDRQEMLDMIHQYRQGFLPLIVPITLLKHHFRKYPQPYIERQYYLSPHPGELMLRNQL